MLLYMTYSYPCKIHKLRSCYFHYKRHAKIIETYLHFVACIIIPGVPEKGERWIFSTLRAESVAYVYIIR